MVHVEASSRCNSHCPMCSRYSAHGFLQPNLKEEDLTPELFYKLFTPEFTRQIDHVYFSGVYGDPCLNKDLPEFVNYLLDHGCTNINIDTNGGYRGEDWWASLAKPGVQINFAVDGASVETLEKYRINVNYDKVLANMKKFIAAGGRAQWNFIVFKHNEHEVELAREIAREIGADFRIKVTQKFRQKKDFKVLVKGQYQFSLEPPVQEKYRHPNIGVNEHTPHPVYTFDLNNFGYLNNNKVRCKTVERKDIFLSAGGLLMPCCYIGTYTHDSPGSYQFNLHYKLDDFDLKTKSVEEVITKFSDISAKWNDTIKNGNLITCLWTCGQQENTTLYHSESLNKQNILGR